MLPSKPNICTTQRSLERLLKLRKRKLVRQPQRQPRMLQHVIKAQILNLILRRMDLLIRVLEIRLDDESRWVSSLRCASVIRARIAALGEDVGDITVLLFISSAPTFVRMPEAKMK